METEHEVKKNQEEVLEKLEVIEAELRGVRRTVSKMRKFMFWRLTILLLAILLPSIAIPFFFKNFILSYLGALQSTL